MDGQDDILVVSHFLSFQDGSQTVIRAQFAERVTDGRRPVDACHETSMEAGTISERGFDNFRKTRTIEHPAVLECLHFATRGLETPSQMFFPDQSKILRLHRFRMVLHGPQEKTDSLTLKPLAAA